MNETVTVKVAYPAWAETDKSFKLLTKRNKAKNGFSDAHWFPKKLCTLEKSDKEQCLGFLTMQAKLFNEKYERGVAFTDMNDNIIMKNHS